MIITRQKRAECAAKAYLAHNPMDLDKHLSIEALGASLSPEGVEEILGTDEFTKVVCTGCGRHVDTAIRMIDSHQFCEVCLRTAITILEAYDAKPSADPVS